MSRMADDLTTYPAVMWEVVAAAKQWRSLTVEAGAENVAVNLRHRFHYFRKTMIKQRHPDGAMLTNIMCSIVGTSVQFNYLGHVLDPDGHREVQVLGIDTDSTSVQAAAALPLVTSKYLEVDHSEEAAIAFMKGGKKVCEHEWDVTETRCLLCGEPR